MPEQGVLLAQIDIKFNGQPSGDELKRDLLECTVENSLHLPDMCTIRINDSRFEWIDNADKFTEGNSVEVEAGYQGGTLTPIFKGEIVGLELDLAAHGTPTMVLRCLAKSHRLHHGRYTRSFVDMKDSDIVRKIAGELSLSVSTDTTSAVHKHVIQYNQTNWEFLSDRAARCGCRLYMDRAGTLCFKKVTNTADEGPELEYGRGLISFRPRTSASTQVDKVIVRGWDPQQKQAITSQTSVANAMGMPSVQLSPGSNTAKKAFGSAEMEVVTRVVQSTTEAEALAKSVSDTIGGQYLVADGLCYGEAKIRAGIQVNITKIGTRFSGKYFVTAATHVYTPTEGYTTLFSVSGKQSNTVMAILEGPRETAQSVRGDNIVVGIVTDNKDPDKMGRVKVKFPWLSNDQTQVELESTWARIASQMAGKNRGFFNLPEIDDEVLIAFEHGDINRPFVLGMLWNGKDTMPDAANVTGSDGGQVHRRGYYTRIGHKLVFNDKDDKGDITFTTKNNHVITFDDANKKVEITTTGNHKFVLDDGGKKINAKTAGGHEVSLEDSGSKIIVKNSSGDKMEIQDSGSITIKANMSVKIEAPQIEINATGMAKIDGGGLTDIKGGLVKINS